MNGAFPAAGTTSASEVEAAYKKVSGNIKAVPDDTDAVAPPAAGAAATGNAPAYSLQTDGTTKMAPMQPRPGTSITKKETTPLYPTTAYKLATTALSTPKFKITQTVSNPSKVKSRPNTVCIALIQGGKPLTMLSGKGSRGANGRYGKVPSEVAGLNLFCCTIHIKDGISALLGA